MSARNRFADLLRKYREQRGWTQVETARRFNVSHSLYVKLEATDRRPQPEHAERADALYRTPGVFAGLYQDLMAEPYRIYPDYFAPVVPYEEKAVRINGWELGIPGLLQTEEYARALIRITRHSADDEEIERLVSARLERQEIFNGDNPPKVWYVLDEGAIRRVVGDSGVLARQIDRLVEIATLPGNVIQILTFDRSGGIGIAGMITVYDIRNGLPIGYTEANRGGRLIEDQTEVSERMTDINMIRVSALSPRESVEFMQKLRSDLA